MGAFDWARYLAAIIIIGVIAGALMFIYDVFAGAANAVAAAGILSNIAIQTATVIYWSIVAYAPINMLFATVAALLVANARAEVNSQLIMTDFGPHILLAVIIFVAFVINLLVSCFLDPFMMAMGSHAFIVASLDVSGLLGQIFSAAHLLCAFAVGIAYLYMILNSIRIQSLQWSV